MIEKDSFEKMAIDLFMAKAVLAPYKGTALSQRIQTDILSNSMMHMIKIMYEVKIKKLISS